MAGGWGWADTCLSAAVWIEGSAAARMGDVDWGGAVAGFRFRTHLLRRSPLHGSARDCRELQRDRDGYAGSGYASDYDWGDGAVGGDTDLNGNGLVDFQGSKAGTGVPGKTIKTIKGCRYRYPTLGTKTNACRRWGTQICGI